MAFAWRPVPSAEVRLYGTSVYYDHAPSARFADLVSEGLPGLLGAIVARGEAQVMRLACIYALLDQSEVIRREHLEAALAVWQYSEASARFIFGDSLGAPVADEILRALRRADGGLTRTEISAHFGRNKTAAEISRALGRLAEHGLAWCDKECAEQGRPAERWHAMSPRGPAHKCHEGNELDEQSHA